MIIGKLIPAGTGMKRYRHIATNAPDYEPLPFYSSDTDSDLDLAEWLRDTSAPAYSAGGEGEGYTSTEAFTMPEPSAAWASGGAEPEAAEPETASPVVPDVASIPMPEPEVPATSEPTVVPPPAASAPFGASAPDAAVGSGGGLSAVPDLEHDESSATPLEGTGTEE